MNLTLALESDRYRPGDEVRGVASWQTDGELAELEVRLFWYTEGKGDRDVGIAESVEWAEPPSGEREFVLRLPEGPISFSGQLVSLIWAVELVHTATGETAREEILVSHLDEEIRIDAEIEHEPLFAVDVLRPS